MSGISDIFLKHLNNWLEDRSVFWTLAAVIVVPGTPVLIVGWVVLQLYPLIGPFPTIAILVLLTVAIVFWDASDRAPRGKLLKDQIQDFEDIGILLSDGVRKRDLLLSFSEKEYESNPYLLLLIAIGGEVEKEPWGRRVSDQVLNLDFECIEDNKSYVTIVKRLCQLAGVEKKLNAVIGDIDFEAMSAELTYKLGDQVRKLAPKVDRDWLDKSVLDTVVSDIEAQADNGKRFWIADNGQASVFLFIHDNTAKKLNKLKSRLVSRYSNGSHK